MNEEEILKECNELAKDKHHELGDCWNEEYSANAIQGLLDLYNQEKEKNKKLEEVIDMMAEDLLHYNDRNMNVVLCIATSKGDTVKDYYFNKVRGEENKK